MFIVVLVTVTKKIGNKPNFLQLVNEETNCCASVYPVGYYYVVIKRGDL